nr:polyprotein [Alfalfa-associated picorna-like virus 2]
MMSSLSIDVPVAQSLNFSDSDIVFVKQFSKMYWNGFHTLVDLGYNIQDVVLVVDATWSDQLWYYFKQHYVVKLLRQNCDILNNYCTKCDISYIYAHYCDQVYYCDKCETWSQYEHTHDVLLHFCYKCHVVFEEDHNCLDTKYCQSCKVEYDAIDNFKDMTKYLCGTSFKPQRFLINEVHYCTVCCVWSNLDHKHIVNVSNGVVYRCGNILSSVKLSNRYRGLPSEQVLDNDFDQGLYKYVPSVTSFRSRRLNRIKKNIAHPRVIKYRSPKEQVGKSVMLDYKLKSRLRSFKQQRLIKAMRNSIDDVQLMELLIQYALLSNALELKYDTFEVDHEMDAQKEVIPNSEAPDVLQSGSAIIHADVISQNVLQSHDSSMYIVKERVLLNNIVDRWFNLASIKWSTSDSADKELLYKYVFVDLISANTNTVLSMLGNYVFMRADVEVLIQVSTGEFHCGSLIAAVIYGGDESESQYQSKNVFSYLQKPHIKLLAGASCEGILSIPFRYPFSMLPLGNIEEYDNGSYAYFSIRVLNPLRVSTSGTSIVTGQVSFRLRNVQVTGLKSSVFTCASADEVDPEMEEVSSLLNTSSNILKFVSNLDKPRARSERMSLVPQMMQNPSIGTGMEEVTNYMGLEATSVVPHMEPIDECDIKYFTRMFGYLTTLKWVTANVPGSELLKTGVSPILDEKCYKKISEASKERLSTYCVPPLAVAASMAGYYRGSIEYKFEVVCTKFHAGRIIVAYVPGLYKKGVTPTLPDLMGCAHVIYDVAKEKEFVFKVPYISQQLMYPRRHSVLVPDAPDVAPVGHLLVYVFNQLAVVSSTVSTTVEINVYVRGGEDFELFIPAQPSLVPKQHAAIAYEAEAFITFLPGYSPWYFGLWHLAPGLPVLRYGAVSDHVCQTSVAYPYGMYSINTLEGKPKLTYTVNGKEFVKPVEYYVVVYDTNGPYYYLIAVPSEYEKRVKAVLKACYAASLWGKFTEYVAKITTAYSSFVFKTESGYSSGTDGFKLVWDGSQPIAVEDDSDFEMFDHEIDDRFDVSCRVDCPLDAPLMLKNLHIGEQPLNLVNILRRFQLYAHLDCSKENHTDIYPGSVELPVRIEGFIDDNQYFWRNIKDNLISYVASCFWFFKGSLRFKFICDRPNVVFWVQHKYDSRYREDQVRYITKPGSTLDMFNHGYSYMMQSSSINPCLEIEVPYYAPSDMVVTESRPTALQSVYQVQYANMGTLVIGANTGCKFTVLYALGDSARFSLFMGAPPMGFLKDIPLEHESGPLDGVYSFVKNTYNGVVNTASNITTSGAGYIKAGTVLNDAADKYNSISDNISVMLTNISSLLQKYVVTPAYQGFKHMMITLISNLTHIILNPTFAAIIVAITATFMATGIFSGDVVSRLIDVIKKIFLPASEEPTQPIIGSFDVDHENTIEDNVSTYGPEIIAILMIVLGLTVDTCNRSKQDSWCKSLGKDIPRRCKDGTFVFIFVRNIWSVLKSMCQFMFVQKNPEVQAYLYFKDNESSIVEWATEVETLCKPQMWERIKVDKSLLKRVMVANNFGSAMMSRFLLVKNKDLDVSLFTRCKLFYDKICKLHKRCDDSSLFNQNSTEPFVVWVYGASGVGKSSIKDAIMSKMISFAQINYTGELYYTVQPQAKYWSGCSRQPCCYFDDFLLINNTNTVTDIVGSFTALKSPAPFNPPMADIPDKNLIYAPSLLYVNSNEAFPVIDGMVHSEALYRRRDILVNVFVDPKYSKYYSNGKFDFKTFIEKYPKGKDIVDSMDWLIYRVMMHPENPQSNDYIDFKYKDFIAYAVKSFLSYRECQLDLEIKRMKLNHRYDDAGWSNYDAFDRAKQAKDGIWKDLTFDRLMTDKDLLDKLFDPNCCFGSYLEVNHENGECGDFDERVRAVKERRQKLAEEEALIQSQENMVLANLLPGGSNSEQYTYVTTLEKVFIDQMPVTVRPPSSCVGFVECLHGDLKFVINKAIVKKDVIYRFGHSYRICLKEGMIIDYNSSVLYPISYEPCDYDKCPFWSAVKRRSLIEEWVSNLDDLESVYLEQNDTVGMLIKDFELKLNKFVTGLKVIMLKIKETCSYVINFVLDNAQLCIGVLMFFYSVYSIYKLSKRDSDLDPELYYSADPKIMRSNIVKKHKPVRVHEVEHENGEVSNSQNLTNCIKRNTVYLVFKPSQPNGQAITARCFMLYERRCLLIKHYWEQIMDLSNNDPTGQLCVLATYPQVFMNAFEVRDFQFTPFKNSSLGYIDIPKSFPLFRDYRKLFAPASFHNNVGSDAFLVETTFDESTCGIINWPTKIRRDSRAIRAKGVMSRVELEECYSYPIHGNGRCGSMLVSGGKIIAVHVGGCNGTGVAEPLPRESFPDCDVVIKDSVIPVLDTKPCPLLVGAIVPVGFVMDELAHHETGVSRLKKSPFYECFGPSVMEPGILSSRDSRIDYDPMVEGCKYHCNPIKKFKQELIDLAFEDLKNLYRSKIKSCRVDVGVVSQDIAILGIDGLKGYEPMKMDTSEGYPFVAKRPHGCSNKAWMFKISGEGDNRRLDSIDHNLQAIMKLKMDMRERGLKPFTVFTDCLKDCKLPKEKVLKPGSTRIFSISPVDFTIHVRQYFLDFAAAYQKAGLDIGTGVGISKNSYMWTKLANKLLQFNDKIIAGDYSKFGPRLLADCVDKALELMRDWYTFNGDSLENDNIRKILGEEIMNAYHLMGNFVYQTLSGAPSGNPLTVIINDIVNQMLIRIAWLEIIGDSDFTLFYDNSSLVTYGDDIIMSVTDEYLDKFNVNSLSNFFGDYDLKFTDAHKTPDGKFRDYVEFHEATFLKSYFRIHPYRDDIWLAPLELDCAKETAYWYHENDDVDEASAIAAEACLNELYGHGPHVYDACKQVLSCILQQRGKHVILRSWYDLDNIFFGV